MGLFSQSESLRHSDNTRVKRHGRQRFCLCLAATLLLLAIAAALGYSNSTSTKNAAPSDAFHWKGRAWKITNGGMAGVAKGNPANLFVDQNGYLHLRIINRGGTYTDRKSVV